MSFCLVLCGRSCRSDGFGCEFTVAGYARAQGKSPVTFGPTDLVCCRTLQGHTGKVRVSFFVSDSENCVLLVFGSGISSILLLKSKK